MSLLGEYAQRAAELIDATKNSLGFVYGLAAARLEESAEDLPPIVPDKLVSEAGRQVFERLRIAGEKFEQVENERRLAL